MINSDNVLFEHCQIWSKRVSLGSSFQAAMGATASSLGSAVGCRVECRAIDTALGQCFIPNSSH